MMKKLTLFILSLAAATCAWAQSVQWAKQLAATGSGVQSYNPKIKIDNSGNVIAAGTFRGSMDFDPGPGVTTMTSLSGSGNPPDGYVQKLNAAGSLLWVKRFDCQGPDDVTGIAVDASGNVLVAGTFWGSIDADPGPGVNMLTAATPTTLNYYLVKLDASGNFVWALNESPFLAAGSTLTGYMSVAVDNAGNVWTASFVNDGAMCWITQRSGSTMQVFNSGQLVAINSTSSVSANVSADQAGNIFLHGSFGGLVDLDPTSASDVHSSVNGGNGFIVKVNASTGAFQWSKILSCVTTGSANVWGMTFDAAGNMYAAGDFYGGVDFDPGTAVAADTLPMSPGLHSFILRLSSAGNFSWVRTYESGSLDTDLKDIVTDASGNVYATGGFDASMNFNRKNGLPRVLTPASHQHAYLFKLSPLGNLAWVKQMGGPAGGNGYSEGRGVALNSSNELIATGTFWDSLDTDYGRPGSIKIRSNGVGNEVYFVKMYTCSADTSVIKTGNVLMANAGGATYQWKNCTTGQDVAGATAQTFTPTVNGSYRLVITNGNCKDSSACYTITGLQVQETALASLVKVIPNPTSGVTTILLGKAYGQVKMDLRNAMGQLLRTSIMSNVDEVPANIDGPAGIYFITVTTNDQQRVNLSVMKQ
jgi:hypothetical protein